MAVVATLSKGYDLEYTWKQVDRGPAKDAASYYIQASWFGHVEDLRETGTLIGPSVACIPLDVLDGCAPHRQTR